MKGEALNPKLANLYRSGVAARDSDIRNLIRYNDISKGYTQHKKGQKLIGFQCFITKLEN